MTVVGFKSSSSMVLYVTNATFSLHPEFSSISTRFTEISNGSYSLIPVVTSLSTLNNYSWSSINYSASDIDIITISNESYLSDVSYNLNSYANHDLSANKEVTLDIDLP